MHILIGLITAVAGLIWALYSLQRAGVNLNAFNPFFWYRRTHWSKKYGQDPLYGLDRPIDAAVVVLLGMAKLEGEISREQKQELLHIFETEFKLGNSQATELFASTSFLLQRENNFLANIHKILAPSKSQFTAEQTESLTELMSRVGKVDSELSVSQRQLIDLVGQALTPPEPRKW